MTLCVKVDKARLPMPWEPLPPSLNAESVSHAVPNQSVKNPNLSEGYQYDYS